MRAIKEWRRSPRVALDRFVVQMRGRSYTVKGDLSTGGVGFVSRLAPREGEELYACIQVPELVEPLVLRCSVRHYTARGPDLYWVGAGFVDVDPLLQQPVERFVDELVLAGSVRPARVRP